MPTNFSWQHLLCCPIWLWLSESCRFCHQNEFCWTALSVQRTSLLFFWVLTLLGEWCPCFFLLIRLRLTWSVEWEERIIFSYTNPKRYESNSMRPRPRPRLIHANPNCQICMPWNWVEVSICTYLCLCLKLRDRTASPSASNWGIGSWSVQDLSLLSVRRKRSAPSRARSCSSALPRIETRDFRMYSLWFSW